MNMVASHKFDDDLNNNLFQAYLDFLDLDENKIKKYCFRIYKFTK